MRRVLALNLLFALMLGGCVTVNVNFPAATAEESAEPIIRRVKGPARIHTVGFDATIGGVSTSIARQGPPLDGFEQFFFESQDIGHPVYWPASGGSSCSCCRR